MVSNRLLAAATTTAASIQFHTPFTLAKPCDPNDALNCRNSGFCEVGSADFQMFAEFVPSLPFLSTRNITDQYCQCPVGFTGVRCDIPYELCPDDKTICFNKGMCRPKNDAEPNRDNFCDCTTAEKEDKPWFFGGRYCEYEQTQVCDHKGEDDLAGVNNDKWFCVNDGECRDKRPIDQKCKCPHDFEGPNCGFPKGKYHKNSCNLKCSHNGQCQFGAKDYGVHELNNANGDFVQSVHENGMHCVCKDGWTGVKCETKLEKCGDAHCYNGAQCIEGEDDGLGNKKFHCDCESAARKGRSFAGQYCQYESTTFCDKMGVQAKSQSFCTNGGQCNPEPHKDCVCEEGFTGPRCEYKVTENKPKCSLNCLNGGKCRSGRKNYDLHAFQGMPLLNQTHIDFMHCVCPKGFAGPDCSVELEFCGEKEKHLCLHGAKCIKEDVDANGDDIYGCDCRQASTSNKAFAGAFCQHSSTTFCAKAGTGFRGHTFCANGGTCVKEVTAPEAHPGCICRPGTSGEHCEYDSESPPPKTTTSAKSASNSIDEPINNSNNNSEAAAVVFSLFIVMIGGIIIGVVMVIRSRRRQARIEREIVAANSNLAPAAEGETELTEDGEKLENVEII